MTAYKCDRCGAVSKAQWNSIDVGYYFPPTGWITIGADKHLCMGCAERALEPPKDEKQ